VQYTHGVLACCEFTGVPLSTLLDEVGFDKQRAKTVGISTCGPMGTASGKARGRSPGSLWYAMPA